MATSQRLCVTRMPRNEQSGRERDEKDGLKYRKVSAHMGEIFREAFTTPAKTSDIVVCGSASALSPQMMAASANDGLSFALCVWRLERGAGELGERACEEALRCYGRD